MLRIYVITLLFYIFTDLSKINALSVERIIGGEEADGNIFRYQGALFVQEDAINKREPVGSITIMHAQFVLAISVCVFNQTDFYDRWYEVVVGTTNIMDNTGLVVQVEALYLSKDFNEVTLENNIVVVKLSTSLNLSPENGLKKLDFPPFGILTYEGRKAKFSGYGYSSIELDYYTNGAPTFIDGGSDHKLRFLDVRILDTGLCLMTGNTVYRSQICGLSLPNVSNQQLGACRGDWGGPLVLHDNILLGLRTKIAHNCLDNGRPGIYSRVFDTKSFLNSLVDGTVPEGTRTRTRPSVTNAASTS